MRRAQRAFFAQSHQRIQRKSIHTGTLSCGADGSARGFTRPALGRTCAPQRTFGVGFGWNEVYHALNFPAKSILRTSHMGCNHRLQCRFSLADMSTAPGACCPKSLSNASRSHADALTSSMTGHIIVPLCARIDVFGFRIMCSGPVDDAPRRLLVGRTSSSDDVQGAASAAVADQGASDVTVFMTLDSAHVTCSAHGGGDAQLPAALRGIRRQHRWATSCGHSFYPRGALRCCCTAVASLFSKVACALTFQQRYTSLATASFETCLLAAAQQVCLMTMPPPCSCCKLPAIFSRQNRRLIRESFKSTTRMCTRDHLISVT